MGQRDMRTDERSRQAGECRHCPGETEHLSEELGAGPHVGAVPT